ncbi:MAG: 50S ribosomal protein L24 [Parcubacteria group bacterium GW2011_GWA2_38_13b]|nr:MAG: 50S ribosomal protein L24 [Parcubacteria group bacterium GW2011_GWA2_38_13b]
MKLKKGDNVLIISGKDKGKKGKILHALPNEKRIMVEGVFIMKKHVRPRRQGEKGQRLEIPGYIDISNAKLVCSKCGKAVRVGYKIMGDKKYRICKKCSQEI